MKNKLNIFLGFLLLMFCSNVNAQNTQIDKVIAVVGENIVLQSEVEAQYQQILAQNQEANIDSMGDLRCNIFDNLLLDRLFLAQALLDSVTVSAEEVDAELDRSEERRVGKECR